MSQWSLPLSPSIKVDLNNKSEITITEEHNHRPQSWPDYTLSEKKEHDYDQQQQQKQKQQQHYSYCHSSSQLKNNNNNNVFSLLFQDTWSLSSLSEEDDDFMYDEDNNKNEKEKDLSAYVFPLPPDNNHDLMDSKLFSSLLYSTIINNNNSNKNKESMISIPPPFSSLSLSSPLSSPPLPIHIKPIPTFHTQSLLFLFGFLFFPCWWVGWYLGTKYHHHHNNQVYQHPPQYENNVHVWSSNSFYNEIQYYSKFNRILSIVSFFLILFIIALIVWYYVGVGKKWW